MELSLQGAHVHIQRLGDHLVRNLTGWKLIDNDRLDPFDDIFLIQSGQILDHDLVVELSQLWIVARQALKNQDQPEMRVSLAIASIKQRRFEEAATELCLVIDRHPDQVKAYDVMARLVQLQPELYPDETGLHYVDLAVQNNPDSVMSNGLGAVRLGWWVVLRGRRRESVATRPGRR